MTRFDRFRLDVTNQCLWHGRERVPLMPKPFAVLSHLVRHAGRLVTHEELLEAVWRDTHVQGDVLRKHLKEIRRVLGDDAASPRLIETVPKRGYRFIAPVTDEAATAKPSSSTIVGRTAECSALGRHLERALAGERQIVFVAGEAGMGKTRLVDAFQRSISAAEPLAVVRGQAVEGFGGKEPYYPLLESLGRLGGGPDAQIVIAALSRCAPTWLLQLPSFVEPDRREDLQRQAAGATQPRMVRELCEALEAIAPSTALVLILEDVHWADWSTLDALSAIARRREPARLLLVCTYRPTAMIVAESPLKLLRRDLLMHGLAHEIALQPLDRTQIAEYIAAVFSPHTISGLDALVHRHSGGNPLFMAATLEHLARRGVLAWNGAAWELTVSVEEIEPGVPDTLRHVLDLQLDQLSDDERRVLMCASVAGETFSSWATATMLGETAIGCETICDALAKRDHIVRAPGGSDAPGGPHSAVFEFKHALYRDALYRRLPAGLRMEYHARLAEALDRLRTSGHPELAGEIGAHYESARVYGRALENMTRAAEGALQRCAHHEAVALLTHARELAARIGGDETVAREVSLLQRTGDAHYAHGDMVGAADAYDAAATAAARAHLAAEAAQALLRVARAAIFFDASRALASCERAERVASVAGRTDLQAGAIRVRTCWELLHCGWSRERAVAAAKAFAPTTDGHAVTPAERILWANVQVLRSEYAAAVEGAERALRELSPDVTLWEQLAAVAAKSTALSLLGRYREAYEALQDAMAVAARNENEEWLDILAGALGAIHLHLFDCAGAREITSTRMQARAGAPPRDVQLMVVRGAAELALGRIEEAARCFGAALAPPPNEPPVLFWYSHMFARIGLAEVALIAHDVAKAHDEALALSDEVAGLDETLIKATVWELGARVALARGARDEADAAIDRALQALAPFEVPAVAWRVHATAAAVHHVSDPARAEAHRRRAQDILQAVARSVEGCEPLHRALHAAPAFQALMNADLQASR